jgi:anti-sigma factor RsiW
VSPERHEEIQELLGVYAVDAVDDAERAMIEAHLEECPRCRAEVAEHLETAAMLAATAERAPDGVWDAISQRLDEGESVVRIEDVRAERADRERPRQPWRWVTGAVAAVAVAAAVSLGVAVTEQQRRIDRLTARVEQAGVVRAASVAVFRDDARLVTLASEDGTVEVEAVILPNGQGFLVDNNLRDLPQAETYQLWALGGEEPISLGPLGPEFRVVAFPVDPRTTTLAITVEPAGGVVAPSSTPVAAGEVQTV